jgi:hypothetical protein
MRSSRWSAQSWGLLVLVGLGAGAAAPAHAETLRWKFKPGETLHWVMDRKEVFTRVEDERETKTTISQTTDMSWTVKSVAEDGTAILTLKVDKAVAKLRTPYGVFEYDSSANKPPANPTEAGMKEMMKIVVGAEFGCKFSATGELSDVRLPEQLAKDLAEQKKTDEEGNAGFAEQQIKSMFTSMSTPLPGGDVAPGKSWTRQAKFATPPAGKVTVETTYHFRGPDAQAGANVVRIDLESKATPELPADSQIKVTVKAQEGAGNILFDVGAGRVVKSSNSEKDERHISDNGMEYDLSKSTTTSVTLVK